MTGPQSVVSRSSLSSRDEDEVTDFVQQMYVDTRIRFVDVPDDASFAVDGAAASTLGVDRFRTNITYRTQSTGFEQYMFLHFNRGAMRSTSADSGEIDWARGDSVACPLDPMDLTVVDQDVSTLRLPLDVMGQIAAEVSGRDCEPFAFTNPRPVSQAMRSFWLSTTRFVDDMLTGPDSLTMSALIAQELTHTACVGALHAFPNTAIGGNHFVTGPGWVAPASVRRAVDYIDANAASPLTLTDIATAAGTGPRALRYGFRRQYGITPMQYLRRVRLERAHADLRAADPAAGATVKEIAARWGFGQPDRFATAYRSTFGVLPSRTLRDGA